MKSSNHSDILQKILLLSKKYANKLKEVTDSRVAEMQQDDTSHYLIYRVLGVNLEEGKAIDLYQNKGRFLYKYAGSFLEEASKICFTHAYPDSKSEKIPNTEGKKPKNFEIDCLFQNNALEIKWRDATTDGDHITKEHTRLKVIANAGYNPIRIMFYYPNRAQAIRIQQTLETLYLGLGGEYYYGDQAWRYVQEKTAVDLKGILEYIASESTVA